MIILTFFLAALWAVSLAGACFLEDESSKLGAALLNVVLVIALMGVAARYGVNL